MLMANMSENNERQGETQSTGKTRLLSANTSLSTTGKKNNVSVIGGWYTLVNSSGSFFFVPCVSQWIMWEQWSFTFPVMHYWSVPCVMVSDEGWWIPDNIHIELTPWLKLHYSTCALNFNYSNHFQKRLDLKKKKNLCSLFSWLTEDHLNQKVRGDDKSSCTGWLCLSKRITCFWLRIIIFAFVSLMDSVIALLSQFYTSPSSVPPMSCFFHQPLVARRTPILLDSKELPVTNCSSGVCAIRNAQRLLGSTGVLWDLFAHQGDNVRFISCCE